MASKRMFSKDIVQSDAFLDMPASTQALYFQLGMEADDDGFLGNPRRLMKVLGASDDDLKILVAKRFVLIFPSGVVVIKHHRINNNWDKYNCKRTVYLEEFNQLFIKENKAYTLDSSQGVSLQTENSLKTVSRIEENRIEERRGEQSSPYTESRDADDERIKPTRKKTPLATSMVGILKTTLAIRTLDGLGGYGQALEVARKIATIIEEDEHREATEAAICDAFRKLVEHAASDKFHRQNMTNMGYINRNFEKLYKLYVNA